MWTPEIYPEETEHHHQQLYITQHRNVQGTNCEIPRSEVAVQLTIEWKYRLYYRESCQQTWVYPSLNSIKSPPPPRKGLQAIDKTYSLVWMCSMRRSYPKNPIESTWGCPATSSSNSKQHQMHWPYYQHNQTDQGYGVGWTQRQERETSVRYL